MKKLSTLILANQTYILCLILRGLTNMKISIPYSRVVDGYHCIHNYDIDVRVNVSLHEGKYSGSSVVYKKHVPINLVLGLVGSLKSLPKTSPRITGFGNGYVLVEGELVNYSDTKPVATNEGYYAN